MSESSDPLHLSWPWRRLFQYCGFLHVLHATNTVNLACSQSESLENEKLNSEEVTQNQNLPLAKFSPSTFERLCLTRSFVNFVRIFNWICFFLCFFAFFETALFGESKHLLAHSGMHGSEYSESDTRGPIYQGVFIQIILMITHLHINLGWEASLNFLGYKYRSNGRNQGPSDNTNFHFREMCFSDARRWTMFDCAGLEVTDIGRGDSATEFEVQGAKVTTIVNQNKDVETQSGQRNAGNSDSHFGKNSCGPILREILGGTRLWMNESRRKYQTAKSVKNNSSVVSGAANSSSKIAQSSS